MPFFYSCRSASVSWVRPDLLQAQVIKVWTNPVTRFPLVPLVANPDIWKKAEEIGCGCNLEQRHFLGGGSYPRPRRKQCKIIAQIELATLTKKKKKTKQQSVFKTTLNALRVWLPHSSKDGAWTDSINITQELAKDVNSRPCSGTTESETWGVGPRHLSFTSPPVIWHMTMCMNHCSRSLALLPTCTSEFHGKF